MRAAPLIWEAAGQPDPRRKTKPARGVCWWCAIPIDGPSCTVDDTIPDTFTDYDRAAVTSSPLLCCGCAWAMTGRPPDTLRLWSIAYVEDGRAWPANHPAAKDLGPRIHAQNKADPSAFRALLRDPPDGRWVCSVADSGQIHTLPSAEVNHGRGGYSVRYERSTVRTTAAEYRRLDDVIAELMSAGFGKGEIADEPSIWRLSQPDLRALWMSHRATLQPYRGGLLLDLALFLARKDKTDDDTDDRGTERVGAPTGSVPDGERGLQRGQAAGPGAPDEVRDRGRGIQGSLFGDAGEGDGQAPDREAAPRRTSRSVRDRR